MLTSACKDSGRSAGRHRFRQSVAFRSAPVPCQGKRLRVAQRWLFHEMVDVVGFPSRARGQLRVKGVRWPPQVVCELSLDHGWNASCVKPRQAPSLPQRVALISRAKSLWSNVFARAATSPCGITASGGLAKLCVTTFTFRFDRVVSGLSTRITRGAKAIGAGTRHIMQP